MKDTGMYWEVVVTLPPQAEELWSAHCFEEGASGCQTLEETPAQMRLCYYVAGPERPDVAGWLARFGQSYPGATAPMSIQVQEKPVEDWATTWRVHFRPLPVGQRLLVTPPWALTEPDFNPQGRLAVVIEPGQGFGTGNHATTALVLSLLEARLAQAPLPAALLDVGCGSGILAIAGALLGVAHCWAVDNDCRVQTEVQHNFRLSGIAHAPVVLCAGPQAVARAFPLVLANIIAPVLLELAPELARVTQPGGTLILGGVQPQEQAGVLTAYAALGFVLRQQQAQDTWVSLWLERK